MDIIVNLKDTGIDLAGITPAGASEEVRKDIFDAVKDEYETCAADREAYLYENFDGDRFLFGALEPEKLVGRANAWNQEIREEFLRCLKAVYKADSNGILPRAEDLQMDTTETYQLQQAARELDNSWHDYAEHTVYMANSMGYPYFTVVLSDDALKDIRENPQDYAIITVSPKS